jgi:hypothetical protein
VLKPFTPVRKPLTPVRKPFTPVRKPFTAVRKPFIWVRVPSNLLHGPPDMFRGSSNRVRGSCKALRVVAGGVHGAHAPVPVARLSRRVLFTAFPIIRSCSVTSAPSPSPPCSSSSG